MALGTDAAAAPVALMSVEVVAQSVDVTQSETDGPTSCELAEEVTPEENEGYWSCRLTCQLEYSLCQTGGAPNCTYHYNQCMNECSQLPS